MKIRSLFFLLVLGCLQPCSALYAQRAYSDILLLNDGSQICGHLNRRTDSLVCIASGRNLFCYPANQVKGIRKLKFNESLPWDSSFSRCFYSHTSMGVMAGDGVAGTYIPISFEYSFMWQLARCYAVGLQTGLETFEYLTVPFMLRNLISLNAVGRSPYAYFSAGLGCPFGARPATERDRYLSGAAYETGLGYRVMIREAVGLSVSIGFRYQKLSSEKENSGWGGGTYITDFEYNRIILRLGLSIW